MWTTENNTVRRKLRYFALTNDERLNVSKNVFRRFLHLRFGIPRFAEIARQEYIIQSQSVAWPNFVALFFECWNQRVISANFARMEWHIVTYFNETGPLPLQYSNRVPFLHHL